MSKHFNKEIAQLKRNSYWIGVELRQADYLVKRKSKQIADKVVIIDDLKKAEKYDEIKQHERWKTLFLKELDALIDLQTRLRTDRAEVGRQILDIRQNNTEVKDNKIELVKLSNINYMVNKLIKKRKQQKLVNLALRTFKRIREQVLAGKPIIVYRKQKYPLNMLPWTIEQIEQRIANYESDQKENGRFIQKVRDTIAKDDLKKQQYRLVIQNIKVGQSGKV